MKLLAISLLLLAAQFAAAGSKDVIVKDDKEKKKDRDWCEWLQDDPGLLYKKKAKKNPVIQEFQIGARFQYQYAYLDGNDVNDRDFHDDYNEVRRLRLETNIEFLRFFSSEININLVDDRRFRDSYPYDLDWGYDTFDELTLTFDIEKAFGGGPFDKIELTYGRMKLKIGEEAHQSSRRILTIERSAISDKAGGQEGRPTGALLTLGKGDWELSLGYFSGEDDSDSIGGWNDGRAFYGSLEWEPNKHFRLVYDHVQNSQRGIDTAFGYAWVGSLAGIYEDKRWGMVLNGFYGDNGGIRHGHLRRRRQGDFWGLVAMPWFWVVEDRLQAVLSYQYQGSEEEEGIRVNSRYLRAKHDDPLVDIDGGRGDSHHSVYAGLNYHLCGDNVKFMAGVSYSDLAARTGDVTSLTYMLAFRTFF